MNAFLNTKRTLLWPVVGFSVTLTAVGCGPMSDDEQDSALEREIALSQAQPRDARCASRKPTAAELEIVNGEIDAFATRTRAPGSVNVNVYVHVINKGKGLTNGDVP